MCGGEGKWPKRLAAILLAGLVFSFAGVVQPASAAVAPCSTQVISRDSKGRATKTVETCFAAPRVTGESWVVGYRGHVENVNSAKPIPGTCSANVSKIVTYSLSATVAAEAKAWVFAKVSASVSGGVSNSMVTGYNFSTSFEVPARKTGYCERGVKTKRFETLRTVTTRFYAAGTLLPSRTTVSRANVTGSAPFSVGWKVYFE